MHRNFSKSTKSIQQRGNSCKNIYQRIQSQSDALNKKKLLQILVHYGNQSKKMYFRPCTTLKEIKNKMIQQIILILQNKLQEINLSEKSVNIWFESLNNNFMLDYRLQEELGTLNNNQNYVFRAKIINDNLKVNIQQIKSKQIKFNNLQSYKNTQKFINKLTFCTEQKQNLRKKTRTRTSETNKNSHHKTISTTLKEKPLSKYKIIRCLSVGGFSKVFLIRQLKTGKFYAGKFIEKTQQEKQERQKLIYMQKQVNQKIDHTFIAKMHEFIETQNFYVFVLEFCVGGEMFYQLKSFQRITEEQARVYFVEVLLVIEYLHDKNIIFRDIKPQNILLDAYGHIKFSDFGLAKQLQSKRSKTFSYCGSVEYMAPEIIINKGHSFEVDYYCLGVLLFEIIIGYPPFYNPTLTSQQVKQNIIYEQVKFPQHSNLSEDLKDLLLSLLEKNPKHRLGFNGGPKQIMMHPWIKYINRQKYKARQIKPPLIPKLNILNFDISQIGQSQDRFTKKLMQESRKEKYQKFDYLRSQDSPLQFKRKVNTLKSKGQQRSNSVVQPIRKNSKISQQFTYSSLHKHKKYPSESFEKSKPPAFHTNFPFFKANAFTYKDKSKKVKKVSRLIKALENRFSYNLH